MTRPPSPTARAHQMVEYPMAEPISKPFIAGRQRLIEIIFDFGLGNSAHSPVWLCDLLCHDAPLKRWRDGRPPPSFGAVEFRLAGRGRSALHWRFASYEIVWPGFISSTFTLGTSFCNSAGVPVN